MESKHNNLNHVNQEPSWKKNQSWNNTGQTTLEIKEAIEQLKNPKSQRPNMEFSIKQSKTLDQDLEEK